METLFTTPQIIVIGCACLAAGIIIGAWLVIHVIGGVLLGGRK